MVRPYDSGVEGRSERLTWRWEPRQKTSGLGQGRGDKLQLWPEGQR